jgi:hypothetical protein
VRNVLDPAEWRTLLTEFFQSEEWAARFPLRHAVDVALESEEVQDATVAIGVRRSELRTAILRERASILEQVADLYRRTASLGLVAALAGLGLAGALPTLLSASLSDSGSVRDFLSQVEYMFQECQEGNATRRGLRTQVRESVLLLARRLLTKWSSWRTRRSSRYCVHPVCTATASLRTLFHHQRLIGFTSSRLTSGRAL